MINDDFIAALQDIKQSRKKSVSLANKGPSTFLLNDETAVPLANSLRENTCLEELDLTDSLLSEYGFLRISKALKCTTTLTFLDLKKTNISASSLVQLLTNVASLKKVGLKYCRSVGLSNITALADCLQKHATNLDYLELTACNVDCQGIKAICKKLPLTNIRTIDFEWNLFDDEGAFAIGELLKQRTRINTAWLYNQYITAKGVDAIMQPLLVSGGLQHFGIGVIRQENLAAMISIVESNQSIVELVLDFEYSVDLTIFFRALMTNKKLENVRLFFVDTNMFTQKSFTEACTRAFCDWISQNTMLTTLKCNVIFQTHKDVLNALEKNFKLLSIDIVTNSFIAATTNRDLSLAAERISMRNVAYLPRNVHKVIVDVCLAMSDVPLINDYVVLWIINWLEEFYDVAVREFVKMRTIRSVRESIRRVRANRRQCIPPAVSSTTNE